MLDTDKAKWAEWIEALRTLIEHRVGLRVDGHREEDLVRSATKACARFGYAGPPELLNALSGAPDDAPVFEHLIADVTIGESHFFRDEAQMAFLQQELLPELVAARTNGSRTLRVWSAGASEGQELYSIAIMLDELLDDCSNWHLHLLGSDLNVQALRRAIDGHYSAWSLRGLSESRRRRYFDATESGRHRYRLKAHVRRMARFSYLNLAADEFPRIADDLHAMDLILCRNVFIYFDAARVREILQRMVATLAPGGVLLVGASDLVSPQIPGLKMEMRPGMSFYRKPTLAEPAAADTRSPRAPAARTHSRAHAATRAPSAPAAASSASSAPRAEARSDDLPAIVRTLERAQRWDEIARLADAQPERFAVDSQTALAASRAFGNLGQLDTALRWCESVLQRAQTDPDAHFLRALLLHEAGQTHDALQAFRRAIFLRPDFVLAHYQYALLQLNAGRRERGLRGLETVRRLLAAAPADRELQGAEHLSYGRLAQVIDNELSLHHDFRPE